MSPRFIGQLQKMSKLSSDGFTIQFTPEWGDLVNENYLKASLQAHTPIGPVLSAVFTSVQYC